MKNEATDPASVMASYGVSMLPASCCTSVFPNVCVCDPWGHWHAGCCLWVTEAGTEVCLSHLTLWSQILQQGLVSGVQVSQSAQSHPHFFLWCDLFTVRVTCTTDSQYFQCWAPTQHANYKVLKSWSWNESHWLIHFKSTHCICWETVGFRTQQHTNFL